MANIVDYDPEYKEGVLECIAGLQDYERSLNPDKSVGADIAEAYLEQLLEDEGVPMSFLVAVEGDVVVGFAVGWEESHLEYQDKYFYLSELFVKEEFRGQGIAQQFISLMEDKAKSLGDKMMLIGVMASNTNAIGFYKHEGYSDYNLELVKHF